MRQFSRKAGHTGLAQGKHRVNYGAAVRDNMSRMERATADFKSGSMSNMEYQTLWRMQMETAMGATATGINALGEGLNVLVGLSDKQMGIMKFLAGSIQTTRAMVGIHRAWVYYAHSQRQRQMALAAAETAQAVAEGPTGWVRIAAATAGVGMAVAAGYATGYYAGKQRNVDLNTSWGQREAVYRAKGVA